MLEGGGGRWGGFSQAFTIYRPGSIYMLFMHSPKSPFIQPFVDTRHTTTGYYQDFLLFLAAIELRPDPQNRDGVV